MDRMWFQVMPFTTWSKISIVRVGLQYYPVHPVHPV